MTPEIAEIVGRQTQPKELDELAQRCKDLVKTSRDEMSKHYDQWDYFDMVYRGERKPDLQDRQARQRGEPEKLILPLTFSQVQTFVAFGHSLYNQRDYFYEMDDSGAEDHKPAEMASAILEQNLRYNKFRSTKLIQFLTDIARFGLGVTKETWDREVCYTVQEVPEQQPVRSDLAQPVAPKMVKQVVPMTKYLGNKIVNISPYRWFPDVRLPLTRWTEGEFCADETEESLDKLREMEADGRVAGMKYVPEMPSEVFEHRRMTFNRKPTAGSPYRVSPQYALITEVQIRLNPARTVIEKKPDGTEVFLNPDLDYNTIYIVWIANDSRIIRIEEAGYDHEQFGYNCAQLFDDQNRFVNFSLAEVLSAIQDTATWFLNSHITSVRKHVFGQAVIDPSAIEIDDITNRRPYIRLKAGRGGAGVDSWYKQLVHQDVTQNHVNDVGVLSSMGKEATGINETLLGQFSPGRRSAREAANVANYGASRLVMIFASIWESALDPQARKMLSNLRQGLDEETVVRVYGQLNTQEAMQPDFPGLPPPLYRLIKITKADLVGNYDLAPFNGTLPSQNMQQAGVLREVLDGMLKNPQFVQMSGLDPQLIFLEMLTKLGIRNVQRFRLTPERLAALTAMAGGTANPASPGSPPVGGQGA